MTTILEALEQGIQRHRSGDLVGARSVYEQIAAQAPGHPCTASALANLATIHELENRLGPARTCAHTALAIDESQPVATLVAARSDRREGKLTSALERIEAIPRTRTTPDLVHERARLLDRVGRHGEAYTAFVEAHARIQAQHPPVNRGLLLEYIQRIRTRFTTEWVSSWTPVAPSRRPPPLFIVGFNRSGTTLLDRMLDAHPRMHVLEEVPAIDAARQVLGNRDPDGLGSLDPAITERIRAAYFNVVDQTCPTGFDGMVVDKLPLNTIQIGLIHRIFPRAKFVLALRHPADVVLSNFMQHYQPNPITVHFRSLELAAHLYAEVMGLGQHFQRVLPISVLPIRYEDLVADWQAEVRRLLDFASLPWDDALLGYQERAATQGVIGTPSYDQVVEPIFQRSIGRWQGYRAQIAPVLPVLQPCIQAFGYDPTEQVTSALNQPAK